MTPQGNGKLTCPPAPRAVRNADRFPPRDGPRFPLFGCPPGHGRRTPCDAPGRGFSPLPVHPDRPRPKSPLRCVSARRAVHVQGPRPWRGPSAGCSASRAAVRPPGERRRGCVRALPCRPPAFYLPIPVRMPASKNRPFCFSRRKRKKNIGNPPLFFPTGARGGLVDTPRPVVP